MLLKKGKVGERESAEELSQRVKEKGEKKRRGREESEHTEGGNTSMIREWLLLKKGMKERRK